MQRITTEKNSTTNNENVLTMKKLFYEALYYKCA